MYRDVRGGAGDVAGRTYIELGWPSRGRSVPSVVYGRSCTRCRLSLVVRARPFARVMEEARDGPDDRDKREEDIRGGREARRGRGGHRAVAWMPGALGADGTGASLHVTGFAYGRLYMEAIFICVSVYIYWLILFYCEVIVFFIIHFQFLLTSFGRRTVLQDVM